MSLPTAKKIDPPSSVREYVLSIRATNEPAVPDDETQEANFTLVVTVLDINDNAPICQGATAFVLPENAEVFSPLRRVMAEDIDSGRNGRDGLMFFVGVDDGSGSGSGDPLCSFDNPFRVDPDSGYISICLPLDFETTTMYDINITACDSGFPMLCTVCPIMIAIMDINDNPPEIFPPTEFSVNETVSDGFVIGCINATDADMGQNALLNYSISECSPEVPFLIAADTGCIEVCLSLDFETTQLYTFEVLVTDNGSI